MINGHDLEAFGYYEQAEAHRQAAAARVVTAQNDALALTAAAFGLAMDLAAAHLQALQDLSMFDAGDPKR